MISLIAAIGKNRELGKDNKLLWNIPEDLKRFKQITLGHPIIMGRKTFESIGRVLPDRMNIIVTRSPEYNAPPGTYMAGSVEDAIKMAKTQEKSEIFVIGGGQIFEQALPFADKLYLTIVNKEFDADTFFPDYKIFTKVIRKEEGESNGFSYTFIDLEK